MKSISVRIEEATYDLFKAYCEDNGISIQESLSSFIKSKARNYITSFPKTLIVNDIKYERYCASNFSASYVTSLYDKNHLLKYIHMQTDRTIRCYDREKRIEYIMADYIGTEVIVRKEMTEV